MKINDIKQAIKADSGRFTFETLTEPKLTKKNRTTKEPTAFKVQIKSRFTADVGLSYTEKVNEALEFLGRPADFEAQQPKGKHYVDGSSWLMQADADPEKYYVALSGVADTTRTYLIDGVPATPEQVEDLKTNYLPTAGKPSLVPWRTYSIESITSVEPA